ncbi:MAG: site-specific DNA-methyltransferase [Rhodocyclaceae bacterium]|nr:site-specific DNA-methyltransferase [Rhodocyclaceae bacterium]
MQAAPTQVQLFESFLAVYADAGGPLNNAELYRRVASKAGIADDALNERVPIGEAKQKHSPVKRTLRWVQQNMRRVGMLERLPERGNWQLTAKAKAALTKATPGITLLGFSTTLGAALWTESNEALWALDEPISCCLTSPPYPIRKGRAYGTYSEQQYIDFICAALEPVVAKLAPGGSIALNITNDSFIEGLPVRSMYRERLVIAMHERFGLYKCDELIWHNPSKPPGPIQWASLSRVQLGQSYEPILWFCKDPKALFSNNQRVLQPHTEKHQALIARGGEQREAVNCDGAYRIKKGSYGKPTAGRIPRNVLEISHTCKDQRAYKKTARALGLPVHGAPMPLKLAQFLVEFLTAPGHLVVDRFGGSQTTAKACELTGRRWITLESALEYVRGGAERFRDCPGFEMG